MQSQVNFYHRELVNFGTTEEAWEVRGKVKAALKSVEILNITYEEAHK